MAGPRGRGRNDRQDRLEYRQSDADRGDGGRVLAGARKSGPQPRSYQIADRRISACHGVTHDISNLRKEAAAALGEIAHVDALPHLEAVLDDPDPDVRKNIVWASTALERRKDLRDGHKRRSYLRRTFGTWLMLGAPTSTK